MKRRRTLKTVEKQTSKALDLHLIVDNYATHKHGKVKTWLKQNNRVHLHFIPTSSSWLNLVERFFGLLTERQLRRVVFASVKELEEAIMKFIGTHNEGGKPFVWTKTTGEILLKVGRAPGLRHLTWGRAGTCSENRREYIHVGSASASLPPKFSDQVPAPLFNSLRH